MAISWSGTAPDFPRPCHGFSVAFVLEMGNSGKQADTSKGGHVKPYECGPPSPAAKGRTGFVKAFYAGTFRWLAILLAVPVVAELIGGPPAPGAWTSWKVLYLLSGWTGFFLPFAIFGGGLAGGRTLSPGRFLVASGGVSLFCFLLMGYAQPRLEYRINRDQGETLLEKRYPTGPPTLRGLLELRARIRAAPPGPVSFSVEAPLQAPESWVTHRIHLPLVTAVLATLMAVLGALVGIVTSGIQTGGRPLTRWALGLGFSVLTFLSLAAAGDWVRGDPARSGILGAWLPILPSLLGIGVCFLLLRSGYGAALSPRDSSND